MHRWGFERCCWMHIMSVDCLIEKIPTVGLEFLREQWIWNPFSPVGATQEWPGDTLDSDKWLSPSPFILFTIQRLSLNKTLFFYSPCSWLLCLNEPICWRTPPGRTWSLTRTDAWLQHVVSGKNQFLHKRTEIHSCISVLATSSKLLWYFLKPWPGGKSQHLFSFNLSISRKCLKTVYNDSDKGEQRTRTECICYCCS